jgi:hypothetical protein
MRSATIIAITLAILAGAGCKPVSPAPPAEPEPDPVPRRAGRTAAALDIPPGHLPPPGMCRVWLPGEPPGHQPKARSCTDIERSAPAGSWIVQRPGRDRSYVHVRVVDERRPGVVIRMQVYQIRDGKLVRQG